MYRKVLVSLAITLLLTLGVLCYITSSSNPKKIGIKNTMATSAQLAAQNPTGFNLSNGDPQYGTQYIGSALAPQQSGQIQDASTQATPVDPYAAYGGTTAYNNMVNGYNTQQQNIQGSAQDQANAYGNTYHNNILDFLTNQQLGQTGIDNQATKNELAKQQGVTGILGMVGRGVKSSGVQLANRNAGDSSAAQALADAYGQLGRQQLGNVGNQYALGQNDVQHAQDTFNTQQQMGVRDLQSNKMDNINSIVNNARTQLNYLDAQMANANLPNRLAIDQLKQDIQDKAVAALQGYDQQLQSGVGDIHALGPDQIRSNAAGLATAGTNLGSGAFNFTAQAPIQFQNSGPTPSTLPLFSLNKSKQTA